MSNLKQPDVAEGQTVGSLLPSVLSIRERLVNWLYQLLGGRNAVPMSTYAIRGSVELGDG